MHAAFDCRTPHGDVYARFGDGVLGSAPVIPPVCRQRCSEGSDLRERFGIPHDATVFGSYGTRLNDPATREAILRVSEMRPSSIFFVLVGTMSLTDGLAIRASCTRRHPSSSPHPAARLSFIESPFSTKMEYEAWVSRQAESPSNIICLPPCASDDELCCAIRTCDAMLHGQADLDVLGIEAADFAAHGRPVIASRAQSHAALGRLLGAIRYVADGDADTLIELLLSFDRHEAMAMCGECAAYAARFAPLPVMTAFAKAFLAAAPPKVHGTNALAGSQMIRGAVAGGDVGGRMISGATGGGSAKRLDPLAMLRAERRARKEQQAARSSEPPASPSLPPPTPSSTAFQTALDRKEEPDEEERCVRVLLTSPPPLRPPLSGAGLLLPASTATVVMALATMQTEGALVLAGAVNPELADALKVHVDAELNTSLRMSRRDPTEEHAHFGDVLSRHCRYDLKLRIEAEPVRATLRQLFAGLSVLSGTLQALLGSDAELDELACMVSEPGARRQPVHPDTPAEGAEHDNMVVCTGFVALQDISVAMGPTVVWRGTHTPAAHTAWEAEGASQLERSEACVATLTKGDILLFDSRVLHCGTANCLESGKRRRLFYFSLKRARKATGKSGPGTLRAELRGGRYCIEHLAGI